MGLFECSKVLDSSRAEFPARRIVSRRGRGEEKGVLAEIWKSKSFDSGGFHSPWTRSSFNVVSKIRNSGLERKIRRNFDRNDIVRSIRQRIRVFLPRFNRGILPG